jgi:hypothetical protein
MSQPGRRRRIGESCGGGLVDETGRRWCGFGRLAPHGVRAAFCKRIGRPADLSLLPVLGVALMR